MPSQIYPRLASCDSDDSHMTLLTQTWPGRCKQPTDSHTWLETKCSLTDSLQERSWSAAAVQQAGVLKWVSCSCCHHACSMQHGLTQSPRPSHQDRCVFYHLRNVRQHFEGMIQMTPLPGEHCVPSCLPSPLMMTETSYVSLSATFPLTTSWTSLRLSYLRARCSVRSAAAAAVP